jgi:hypothetical protein
MGKRGHRRHDGDKRGQHSKYISHETQSITGEESGQAAEVRSLTPQ